MPVGPYEEFAGRHTIMYPLWALLASDWELAYGWCVADQAAQLEAYLKQCYKQQKSLKCKAILFQSCRPTTASSRRRFAAPRSEAF